MRIISNLGEETLSSINDLSEDFRNELDGIYLALTELAENKPKEKIIKPIGFIIHNKEK